MVLVCLFVHCHTLRRNGNIHSLISCDLNNMNNYPGPRRKCKSSTQSAFDNCGGGSRPVDPPTHKTREGPADERPGNYCIIQT